MGSAPITATRPAGARRACLALLAASIVSLTAFVAVEKRVAEPMFRLALFRIRAFTFGTLSTFLSAISRGGLMFMLIIWLQGIWLPLHGYSFTETPLWAGIYMLPLTLGMLVAGPTSGYLSDRFGARWFATGGMLGAALSFALMMLLPTDFNYWVFALVLLLTGISMGMFASPNRAAVMNSLPAADRGAGGGMNQTFQNSAQVLSVGIFFTLLIIGLASSLPAAAQTGLQAHGLSADVAGTRCACAADLDPVRRLPRLQPDPAACGSPRVERVERTRPGGPHRPCLLSPPDLWAVPRRPARGLRVCDRRLSDRGRRVYVARRSLRARRGTGLREGHTRENPSTGGAACTLSGSASPPSP